MVLLAQVVNMYKEEDAAAEKMKRTTVCQRMQGEKNMKLAG